MIKEILSSVSLYAMPTLILAILIFGLSKKIKLYESFVEGGKEGFEVGVRIIPYLVAILVAIGMFRASGAIDLISQWLSPILAYIGMPAELLPLAIVKPLSGNGSFAIMTSIIAGHPKDSFIGFLAATMTGSTETTFYVLAVYFGSVGIYKTRHAVPVGLIADITGLFVSLLICKLLFL